MNKTFIDFLNEVKEKLPNVVEEEIIQEIAIMVDIDPAELFLDTWGSDIHRVLLRALLHVHGRGCGIDAWHPLVIVKEIIKQCWEPCSVHYW